MADIEKVFLMISVAEPDRDYLRFLWIDDLGKDQPEIQVLRFARTVFGVTSSPFLLNGTIKYHLEKNSERCPELVAKLLRSTYVNDVVTSARSEEQAYELYVQAKELLKQAGFNLRKFASILRSLQDRVNGEELGGPPVSDPKDCEESYSDATLGTSQKLPTDEQRCWEYGGTWRRTGSCSVSRRSPNSHRSCRPQRGTWSV